MGQSLLDNFDGHLFYLLLVLSHQSFLFLCGHSGALDQSTLRMSIVTHISPMEFRLLPLLLSRVRNLLEFQERILVVLRKNQIIFGNTVFLLCQKLVIIILLKRNVILMNHPFSFRTKEVLLILD